MKHLFKKIRRIIIACFLLFAILIAGAIYYIEYKLPNIDELKTVQLQVPLQIYTQDRKLIATFGEKRRIPIPYNQIPPLLIKAVLATEDQRYFKHAGVDVPGLGRAGIQGMSGFRERERKMIDDLSALSHIVLSTGGGCVETPAVREYLRERGMVIYMEVSLQTQLNRLKRDKKRPLLQGENPKEVLIRLWEEREPYYEDIADLVVVTDNRSVQDVCEDILAWLRQQEI